VVHIGDVPLGGANPIRVQSMTTTDTMDTQSTVDQSIRMIETGCEYIRITAPSVKEAQNLAEIKKQLHKQGYNTPLIADIHFTPNAAMAAARIVEKVRINPGNFADRKKFQKFEYTDQSYNEELERIHDRFVPLVLRCKEEGCAMRIGSNHGSLSDRILSRYGDTPIGMVESAMEFLRICGEYNYHDIVLSMKASNTRVMVHAYRLLVNRMGIEGMNYPLHLGVTEAGEGEDGRIKSAVGIGTLMEDGLGDTIRVSLTEEPENEIPVAKILINRYEERSQQDDIEKVIINPLHPFEYKKRTSHAIQNIGGDNVPCVIADLSSEQDITPDTLNQLEYTYFESNDKWGVGDFACDYIYVGSESIGFDVPGTLGLIQDYSVWNEEKSSHIHPLISTRDYLDNVQIHPQLNFISISINEFSQKFLEKIKNDPTAVLIITTRNKHGMAEQRRLIMELINFNCKVPLIIYRSYKHLAYENLQIFSATDTGAMFIDGLGDGIFISTQNCGTISEVNHAAFGILQASRTRISKTEYISCPSCGRTLFDLQETTVMIRKRTSHLKGVKIGIMGCIVNGPGEMADADYGYVGTGVNKISLYRGQTVVRSNIHTNEAVDTLINLMDEDGIWVEPEVLEPAL
jgi:(E)-4-hydroxy-3-methylbut-2-enyl-diphosphate synthase